MPKAQEHHVGSPFHLQEFSFAKLQALLTFAESPSLAAAANQLGQESGSVSRQIKDLERFFGCKLRENAGKTAKLSQKGQELVVLLRQQLQGLQDFR